MTHTEKPWNLAARLLSAHASVMPRLAFPTALNALSSVLRRGLLDSSQLAVFLRNPKAVPQLTRLVQTAQMNLWSSEQTGDHFIAQLEFSAGCSSDTLAVLQSSRRLKGYLVQASGDSPQDIIEAFYSELVPALEAHAWGNPDTGEIFIIPADEATFDELHQTLEDIQDKLSASAANSEEIAAVLDEVQEYMDNLRPASSSTDGLAKLEDSAELNDMAHKVAPPELSPADTAPTPQAKGEAADVLKRLRVTERDPEQGISELLDLWRKAPEAERPAIEQRIRKQHKGLLQSFVKKCGISCTMCDFCE